MALDSLLKGQTSNVAKQVADAVINVGKAALHSVMPDDIEYYLCSLELVNCENKRVGFLSFSVMPEQISESYSPLQTMIKTQNAVVTTYNDSFAPREISIAGTFGRKFRMLLNYVDPKIATKSEVSCGKIGFLSLDFGSMLGFGVGVKSGYGMTKILQHIVEYANKSDGNGKPYYLKFFNYSLNTAYLVDVVNFNATQNMASNCIWNYSLTMRAVSNIGTYKIANKMKELLPQVASNSIGNGITKILTGMTKF